MQRRNLNAHTAHRVKRAYDFLTENNLLITNEANGSVQVTLEECEELAQELGARDGLDLACRFAHSTHS